MGVGKRVIVLFCKNTGRGRFLARAFGPPPPPPRGGGRGAEERIERRGGK